MVEIAQAEKIDFEAPVNFHLFRMNIKANFKP